MTNTKSKGVKFFKEGTQNQKILQKYYNRNGPMTPNSRLSFIFSPMFDVTCILIYFIESKFVDIYFKF